jgi:hypothetical protein
MSDKTVTFNISPYGSSPIAAIGDKVKLNRNSWGISRQRIKNKQMIFRMLRKEYYPYFVVTEVYENNTDTVLTIKPQNF